MNIDIREKITSVLMLNSKSMGHFTDMKGAIDQDQMDLLEAYKLINDNLDFPVNDMLLDEVKNYNIKANKVLIKAENYIKDN